MRVTTEVGQMYLDYWIVALHKLLGWERGRVINWATSFEQKLNDENSMLYHETEMYPVSFLLIPKSVRDKLAGLDLVYLAGRLEDAIWLKNTRDKLEGYDWSAAAARIDAILAEHSESLASLRRQYEKEG